MPQGITSRPRLTARLDAEAALTVVRGGQGLGKTVAVADWARQRAERPGSTPGIWFTVDTESGSRLALWSTLMQQILDSGLVGDDESIRALIAGDESTGKLRRKLSQVLSRLQDGVVIVIDNGYLIDNADADELSQDIAAVLAATPRLRVILIVRGELQLERGVHGVVLDTAAITAGDLLFTVPEMSQVMAAARVKGDISSLAAELHAATAGHPLLTRGALIANDKGLVSSTLQGGDPMLAAATAAVREIALSRDWTDEARDFAFATTIPENVSVSLANELSGRSDAEASLNYLESIGLGLWVMDSAVPVFVYVPALQAELRRVLIEQHPERAAALHRVVALRSFEHRKVLSALEHAVAAGDLDLAESFLLRDWLELVRFHGARVWELLGGLSRLSLSLHPLVAMLLAVVVNASTAHKHGAIELFTLVAGSAIVIEKSVPAPKRVLLHLVASVAQRLIGKHFASLASARQAIAAYNALTPAEHDELAAARVAMYTQLGISTEFAGDLQGALDLYGKAAAELTGAESFGWLIGISLQAELLADAGCINEVVATLKGARLAEWPPAWRASYSGSHLQIAEAYLAIEARDFDRAHEHLDAIARHMPMLEHWDTVIRVRGWAFLGQGSAASAVTVLKAELNKPGHELEGFRRAIYDAHLALFEIANGDAKGAELTLSRLPRRHPLANVARALLELSRDRPDEALAAIGEIDPTGQISMHALGNAHLVRSAALLRQGKESEAALAVREATALMKVHGAYTIPLMIPRRALDALVRMAEEAGLMRELAVLQQGYEQPEVFASHRPPVELSERENVVLYALVRTGSTTRIAEELFVSHNTVKSQLRSLYRKLGVGSRADALFEARRQELIGKTAPKLEG